jgi:hypothetical protein
VRHHSLLALAFAFLSLACGRAHAQQFNSDSYISKAHGMATIILTYGDRNDIFMNTFSLLPRWEFTAAVYVYNTERRPEDGRRLFDVPLREVTCSTRTRRRPWIRREGGDGMDPGYLVTVGLQDAFKTYWTNAPATLPLFDNKLSWDIMPGASVTLDYGTDNVTAASFTYSTRLAWYPTSPKWSLVGEVFGAEGGTTAITRVQDRSPLGAEPARRGRLDLRSGVQRQPRRRLGGRRHAVHSPLPLHRGCDK